MARSGWRVSECGRWLWLPLLAALIHATGCSQQIHLNLKADVEHPPKSAIIFLVDGLDLTRLEAMVQAGQLPNIQKRFVAGGTQVCNTVTGMPSVTYANCPSVITGVFPGHHGITGDFWFDRSTLTTHYYMTIQTYLSVNEDLCVPTIYDLLGDRFTLNIQNHTRHGVSATVDNRLAFGYYYLLGEYVAADHYAGTQFRQAGRIANRVKQWPTVTMNYYPGTDDTAHKYGADSVEYGRALLDVDGTIGRITDAVDRAGLGDSTYYVLTADHSHVPIGPCKDFDMARWVREARHLRVRKAVLKNADYVDRLKALERYDVLGGADEDRVAGFYLPGARGWAYRPEPQEVESWVLVEPSLIEVPAVQFVLIRGEADRARVLSRDGTALVERRMAGSKKEYRLIVGQGDPLHYRDDPSLAGFADAGWHGSREWLIASGDSLYPDFVPQVVEMFDSPHMADVVVMAADDWSFNPKQRGGHGSWTRRDTLIPLFFAGPDVPKGGKIGSGRLVDVVPTLLGLLGEEHRLEGVHLDGINMAHQIRTASPGSV